MCQIEKFGASPFRYVRTDIEVHGEERVLTVHNRAAIPIITKRFACYDTPSFYSPVRKEPRDKKQKNRKIQDKQGQAHDRAPKKRPQERESETKPKQKKRGDYRHSYSYSSTLPSGLLRHELRNVSEPAKENPAHIGAPLKRCNSLRNWAVAFFIEGEVTKRQRFSFPLLALVITTSNNCCKGS